MYHTNNSSKLKKEVLWKRVNDDELQIDELSIFGLAKLQDFEIKKVIRTKLLDRGPTDYLIWAIIELRDTELLALIKKGDKNKRTNVRVNYAWIKKLENEFLKTI